jgi:hypothetical protein
MVANEEPRDGGAALLFVYCYAALSASKRARAFFPSLAASAMLSKKTDERSIGAEQQAR